VGNFKFIGSSEAGLLNVKSYLSETMECDQIHNSDHGQIQLTGRNLGRVFNFRFGHLQAEHFRCCQVKLPNLKLKTRPKQLLGSLLFVITLPAMIKINLVAPKAVSNDELSPRLMLSCCIRGDQFCCNHTMNLISQSCLI
jgi:hypothetical protein